MVVYMHWLEKYLLPPACHLCGATAEDEELCHACADNIRSSLLACPLCALPNTDASVCSSCSQQSPVWHRALSFFVYDSSVKELMHQWKYQQRSSAGRVLTNRLAQGLAHACLPEVDAILSIPMHRKKLAKRGFNTAYELARVVAKHQSVPLLNNALIRLYETPAQAGLNKQGRQQNIKGAFQVNRERISGYTRVLLVDDVLTTGATLSVCTELLQASGIQEISILTLARALPTSDL
jgi:ComF family protein